MTEKSTNLEPKSPRRQKNHLLKFAKNVLIGTVVAYVLLVGYLVYNETALVYPGAKGESNWQPDFPVEEVWVDSTAGARIHGWYLPKENSSRFVLLHHGNEEDVAQVAERYARKVADAIDANVLVFDYRGYGKSQGVPNEKAVIDDAEAMLEWLLEKAKLEEANNGVIYFGSSLGGGVAVGLAERRPPMHLILDRTFDAITSAAAERYPWVPVRLLMKNQFQSAERIKSINVPLFQSHFTHDELCSLENAKILFDAAPTERKEFFEIPEGGHYDPLPEQYWKHLKSYADKHLPKGTDVDRD